jgi:integral membrane sensor domain MASE1
VPNRRFNARILIHERAHYEALILILILIVLLISNDTTPGFDGEIVMCFTTFLCAIANGYDGSLMTGLIAVSNIIILTLNTNFLVIIVVVVSFRSELPIDASRDIQPDFQTDINKM